MPSPKQLPGCEDGPAVALAQPGDLGAITSATVDQVDDLVGARDVKLDVDNLDRRARV
jgi:hypothetical protein